MFRKLSFQNKAIVALLAEGVDRNILPCGFCYLLRVALLAEGVDRNSGGSHYSSSTLQSPSSRRAWIEIVRNRELCRRVRVALLAEGVDRNMPSQIRRFEMQ